MPCVSSKACATVGGLWYFLMSSFVFKNKDFSQSVCSRLFYEKAMLKWQGLD